MNIKSWAITKYRFALLLPMALVLNCVLFYVMSLMVMSDDQLTSALTEQFNVELVDIPEDETPEIPEEQVEQQEQQMEMPTLAPLAVSQLNAIEPISAPNLSMAFDLPKPQIGEMDPFASGGEYVGTGELAPSLRINPVYPPQALMNKIEGSVTVAFLIQTNGKVKNLKIEEAAPPGVFNSAVLRAVRRWKFEPVIVDGKPVERRSTATLNFEVDS